ncbi:hypothetical protein Ocin01_16411 [Orchesella cincta]|uniref:Uncharacterized protein n=1 Tax=Orchesella cincta TaxID=48709 RepID=A0A1D2MBJ0_ORCCI|nr:hypothetical protein Ocin01_16411 [Orchesella cincta]
MSGETNCAVGGGRNRANRNRQGLPVPAAVEKGTKIKLGGDHGGNRNLLLPSRMMMGSASSVNLSGIPVPIKTKTLQNSYEVYLQALLTDLVVQQAQSLQGRFHWKPRPKRFGDLWLSVEESLLQIMGALSSKFDRIILEGGGESGGSFFLFHEVNEMRRLMDQLMRGGSRLDTDSSFGFGFLLKEALKDIRIKIEVAKGNNGKFTQNLKALLESCSLDIMNRLVGEHESIQESASFSGSLQDVSDLGMSLPL